jgi:hypothetical protein
MPPARLLVAALAAAAQLAHAGGVQGKGAPTAPCAAEGRFVLSEPVCARSGASGRLLAFDGKPPSLVLEASETPVDAAVRSGKSAVRVRARWRSCAAGWRRLKGRLEGPDCDVVAVHLRGRDGRRRLVAQRSRCGDGFVDSGNGEACDGAGTCPEGVACNEHCACVQDDTPPPEACCDAEQIVLTSTAGTLRMANLHPFVVPAGVRIVMNAGPPAAGCEHDVVMPANGFVWPNVDVPAIGLCSAMIPVGCISGPAVGAGSLWDGHTPAGSARTDVESSADTSDGICNPPGRSCGAAGANPLGNVDMVFEPSGSSGVRTVLQVRTRSQTWADSTCSPGLPDGCCAASTYDPADGDLLVSQVDLVLGLTTDSATAAFVDQNGDGCAATGLGFGSPSLHGPVTLGGSPRPGPCCVVGEATTLVAASAGFSGGPPFYDVGFALALPSNVTACNPYPPEPQACVVTGDPCLR